VDLPPPGARFLSLAFAENTPDIDKSIRCFFVGRDLTGHAGCGLKMWPARFSLLYVDAS